MSTVEERQALLDAAREVRLATAELRLQGLSFAAIADLTGTTEGMVSQRIVRHQRYAARGLEPMVLPRTPRGSHRMGEHTAEGDPATVARLQAANATVARLRAQGVGSRVAHPYSTCQTPPKRADISYTASLSLFRMPHADLAKLLAPKGREDWLLADLTVAELRKAYRRRAVREDDRVLYGLRVWGTADTAIRHRLASDPERAMDELRQVADPLTDYTVRALAGRLYANPAPSPLAVGRVIDHALTLRAIGERYGERGIRAARLATWDYVPVGEFEERMAVFAEFIENFTVAGEPITELIEVGLPDWARPLVEA
ncbi:hypothetical protein [Mycolicibacterium fortuitum]|uniref:hypothetical protein n=1 Tax=Mycolicibacterium fortuitum TaxID=1766 RepID=UPI001CDC3362|nr:hypothetical protein [Mycolicibacterium fortuitum]UBV14983.1 hypothetical protein H8Z57_30595 [Mycolicibacterium fortuitum]